MRDAQVYLEIPPEHHDRDEYYSLVLEVLTTEPEISGENNKTCAHSISIFRRSLFVQPSADLLLPFEEALRGARAAAPLLPEPRNKAGENPQWDGLQLVSVRRGIHREQHEEAKAVRA